MEMIDNELLVEASAQASDVPKQDETEYAVLNTVCSTLKICISLM